MMGWVNDDRIVIFGWAIAVTLNTIPFNSNKNQSACLYIVEGFPGAHPSQRQGGQMASPSQDSNTESNYNNNIAIMIIEHLKI